MNQSDKVKVEYQKVSLSLYHKDNSNMQMFCVNQYISGQLLSYMHSLLPQLIHFTLVQVKFIWSPRQMLDGIVIPPP
jgi:hypothetical protein